MHSILFTQSGIDILAPVADALGWILNVLYEFLSFFGINNTGVTIILFTFIIYGLMIPMNVKQQKFQKLQSKMAPELTKITAKYKGKKDEASMRKQQLETQAVYSKYGASPTGGCLSMLITLPIMFALYKVIQNVPNYVHDIYAMYEPIAKGIQGTQDYTTIMGGYKTAASNLQLGIDKWDTSTAGDVQNSVVQLLSRFKSSDWTQLVKDFPALADIIGPQKTQIINVNSFLGGLNILEAPGLKFPGILIPIMAAGFQFLQVKMMNMTSTIDPKSPTASSMKAMNTVMPLMSGIFCITFPIGVGLYWVAGSVFRVGQQFFINKYMDKIDIDDLIQENIEKQNKKKAKRGIDPNTSVEEISKTRTSSIKETSTKDIATKKITTEPSNYKKSDVSYKAGSISANANLLSRKNADKGDN